MDNGLRFRRFSDLLGIVRSEETPINSAYLVENMRKTLNKSWVPRNGYQKWGDWLTGVTPTFLTAVDGLFWNNNIRQLITAANAKIYREEDGEFLDIFTKKTGGTVSVTNGSPTVTGSGTSFSSTDEGKEIRVGGVNYVVESVANGITLTLSKPYAGTTGTGLAYILGFDLWDLTVGKTRASHYKDLTFFTNNIDRQVKYDGAKVSQWGLDPPTAIPNTSVQKYTTGTVSVTNLSTTVTGSGTAWDDQYAGHVITIDGVIYSIAKVNSPTEIILNTKYQGVTASGLSYAIDIHGPLTGRYFYRVAFINSRGQVSNPGNPTLSVDVFKGRINVDNLPIPIPGTDVVGRIIYRTFAQDYPLESRVIAKAPKPPGGRGDEFPTPDPFLHDEVLDPDDSKADDLQVDENTIFGVSKSESPFQIAGTIDPRNSLTTLSNNPFIPRRDPGLPEQHPWRRRVPVRVAPSADLIYYHAATIWDTHTTSYEDAEPDNSLGLSARYDNDPPPIFKGSVNFEGRIWGWTDDRLYFSKPAGPEAFPVLNYLGMPSEGDSIQRAIKFQGSLVVFRRDDIWVTDNADKPLKKVTTHGTVSGDSVVEVEGFLFYLSSDGIRIFNGMTSRLVSNNLEEFTDRKSWDKSIGVHNEEHNEVIWSVGRKGNTSSLDMMLVYNYRYRIFYTFAIASRAMLYVPHFGLIHGDGYVYFHDLLTDDGIDITWKWTGNFNQVASAGDSIIETIILIAKNVKHENITVNIMKDYNLNPDTSREVLVNKGSPPLWGKSEWNNFLWDSVKYIRKRFDSHVTGFTHRIELTGTIPKFEILGFDVGYRNLGIRDAA